MDREDSVRRTDQVISKMIELWPLWLTLAGGVVTTVNFYNTVRELAAKQKAWEAASNQRREKTREDMEAIRIRIAVIETRLGMQTK